MPGYGLTFICPCGFEKRNVMVGVGEFSHYEVFICLQCQTIFSVKITDRKTDSKNICRKCGKELISIRDKGAWGPASIQEKFPNKEPWLIDDKSDEIYIICPRCKNYTLRWVQTMCWD